MASTSPSTASVGRLKRSRDSPHGDDHDGLFDVVTPQSNTQYQQHEVQPDPADNAAEATSPVVQFAPSPVAANASAAALFRNVSACNRCRSRKNRCDQRLPACAGCEKARVRCVGYDPITKKEIPRSYVYYLETRVSYLENLLRKNEIAFAPPEDFTLSSRHAAGDPKHRDAAARGTEQGQQEKLDKLVSDVGMVSVQGASDPRYLGSTSGISFARVVFAAVKSSVTGTASERSSVKHAQTSMPGAGNVVGMRDSFFGLQTKPTIKPAPFPDKELGLRLVQLYFEHANPQIPILHRGEFMAMFDRVYAADDQGRSARELYMLNIVFAIGSGIIVGATNDPDDEGKSPKAPRSPPRIPLGPPKSKRRKMLGHQHEPEEYHASAVVHLETFLGSGDSGLEELQAVLLLAGFALLRPVAPGLWYVIGVAVRLAVDLGLHYEDGAAVDGTKSGTAGEESRAGTGDAAPVPSASRPTMHGSNVNAREIGRRQWIRDLRRRLFWCTYSLDRLVSTCVGRPFGISDAVVTTEFPSMLDDKYITATGFREPPPGSERPSYKLVAQHYFRLRLLQSEILQVLQHRQAQQTRQGWHSSMGNYYMHKHLISPFLEDFGSFRDWRQDIDHRLLVWKDDAPAQSDTGVLFEPLFLELNYWQAVIMLYRQSLTVPTVLADDAERASDDVSSPSMFYREDQEDEEAIFLKVAEAGQNVLKIYRKLHRLYLVNYTYLATHHLFMAGISFLYAIWHSNTVRSLLTVDDFDFTVLAATSVLGDLIVQCPPAEACRDAFERMSRATIQMVLSTTGFGPQALAPRERNKLQQAQRKPPAAQAISARDDNVNPNFAYGDLAEMDQPGRRAAPRFDMNLQDLFNEEETTLHQLSRPSMSRPFTPHQLQQIRHALPVSVKYQQPQQRAATDMSDVSPLLSQQQHDLSATPMEVTPSIMADASPGISNQVPYAAFAGDVSSAYADAGDFAGFDWLDTFPVHAQDGFGVAGGAGVGGAAGGENADGGVDGGGGGDVGAGLGYDAAGSDPGLGLDLGFGMSWDGGTGASHDWASGSSNIDLFEGFFFRAGNGSG